MVENFETEQINKSIKNMKEQEEKLKVALTKKQELMEMKRELKEQKRINKELNKKVNPNLLDKLKFW